MLIKFYSDESAEFVMLGSTAEQMLAMMGLGGTREGSVSGDALTSALDRLTSAIAHVQNQPASDKPDEQRSTDNWGDDEGSEEPEEVTVSARADPLIAMLRRAKDEDGYVMWRPD